MGFAMAWIALLVAIAALVWMRLSKRVNVDHLPSSFVVFDLKTTGPDPERHEIIEIGALRVDRDSTVHESFRTLVRPSRAVPIRVTELTGITQNAIDAEGKSVAEALAAFTAFIGDLPLVSFNADLGMTFLANAAQRNSVPIRNQVACARKMAARAWPDRKVHDLSGLAKDDKPADVASHRVLDDCRRVLSVYLSAASRLGTVR